MRKGKYSDSKREYIASALGGQVAIEEGYMKDGNLDSSEVSAINTISDLYDGYVED